ncbi:YbdD/YjiX family protein [Pseudonocardia acidicola]|uniref:YbdD/YjiX family protein n=1 Tax=Pseudonocardia acidicola TaxID=2724939 RepID=A0ABX1SJ70_9PSEU|nr:YbdD/YjiX family protein [Pseudonocardia acidicola]NMI00427.1 YbdD/YjiX family protein [Pseudonocardia acidicola]
MRSLWRAVRWYLRELTGEAQYDHYLARHAREHPGHPPMSRREFERRRIDRADARPGSRCC